MGRGTRDCDTKMVLAPGKRTAYPTDAKERQNAQRKAQKERAEREGVEAPKPKKKAFAVEDAHQDCGEDLSSLTDDVDKFAYCEWTDYLTVAQCDCVATYFNGDRLVDDLPRLMFYGSLVPTICDKHSQGTVHGDAPSKCFVHP